MGTPLLLLFTFLASAYCNSLPEINMNLVNVREDLPVGAFAFQIIASDPDGDTLTYSIRGTDSNFFEVNKVTGEVTIKSQLDRETKDLLLIEVVVNDGVYADVTQNVYISVDDANDNAPVFSGLPYNIEVPENVAVGSTLFKASATDRDFGQASIVSFKIDEVVPNEGTVLFSISETSGNVILNDNLNYNEKSPFYQIRIIASDGGGQLNGEHKVQSTPAYAFITVKDLPDINPQFLNLANFIVIKENSNVDKSVFVVKARDPDTGVNDIIRYSIEKTNALDLFQINENTGVVSVKTQIDREELLDIDATVVLSIKVMRQTLNVGWRLLRSTVSDLTITIGDKNDNGPEFYECEGETCTQKNSFTGNVDEHSSAGLAVANCNITVKDPDQRENNKFNLELVGDDKDAFSVSPSSGVGDSTVQVTIKDPQAVDYEKKKVMYVQIIAKDAKDENFISTASVTININDINDHFPVFEKDVYNEAVDEHCEDGTVVATITVSMNDALDDGKITYRLMPESIRLLFDVDPNTGTIYVINGEGLNWEGTNSYSPTLQAVDSKGNIGSTVVMIDIQDINDQTPEMNRDVYETYVKENDDFKLQIKAIDNDDPDTLNSKIQYHIKDSLFSSNFTIDPDSGLLKNNGQLDREAMDPDLGGLIELIVFASDKGTPSLNSSATVIINIEDVNDNSPRFLEPVPESFHVKESESGILVGSLLAHDADQTAFNNRIIFSITEGSFGSFILYSEALTEGYRGDIRVDPAIELDYESDRTSYDLTVEISDLGQNKYTIKVKVIVDDVNDTPPVFPSAMTLEVNEHSSLPGPLGTIKGKDVDNTFLLEYELISSECQCNGTKGPCPEEWFKVERNGDVVAISSKDIDYEKCDKVFLKAMVVDLLTEKGKNSTEGIVTINIVDINDNAPEFVTLQDFYVVVIDKVESGTSVARVYANDRDTEHKNRVTTFKVIEVVFIGSEGNSTGNWLLTADNPAQEDAEGIFSTHIRSSGTTDNSKKGKYMIKVEASNTDGLSSTSVVELLTVDKSYRVSLRFNAPASEVKDNLPKIRNILTSATKATVEIFNVDSENSAQRSEEITVLEAYFVFRNGTALNYDAVTSILNSEEVYREFGYQLVELGFTGISTTITETTEDKTEVFIMIGLMAALAIVLVVTTTSLVCIRRNYKRKLKAAKAMNSAATVVIQNQKSGPVVPGTNKYTKEGANPVLNMNIDTATDLGFDEDGSSADRESLNSLDYNIDMTMTDKDTMPMMAIQEEEEEDDDRSESPYIEPLGAALAQREKRRGADSPGLTFANPSIDTTDL
ncbi:LOW QUALITY PROTEIN: cadherin-related family member 2 [Megalobrama amblycephala]|uniref:LOW QUALITY PROTEIN: cadherin-related family member 2 n=1 Tax=Megalobrama amblycephala TaxID=75352 RepID=UPI002013D5B5|nr:LOW QUALITY PROTEIN: cadherin-related family member 2 [Megalobrama amblycephala]